MTEPNEFASKRAADQRLALLALATTEPEPCGPCLDPELLAALVEGRLSPDEADTCLAHLADCEECYGLWQQLDRLYQEQASSPPAHITPRRISRPRILAAIGTLLAAAASVAVFFDLTTRLDRSSLPHLSEQPKAERPSSMPSGEMAGSLALGPTAPVAPTFQDQADAVDHEVARPNAEPGERSTRNKTPQSGGAPSGGYSNAAPVPKRALQEPGKRAERQEAKTPAARITTSADSQQVAKESVAAKEELPGQQHEAKPLPTAARAPLQSATPTGRAEDGLSPLRLIDWENRIRQDCHGHPTADRLSILGKEGRQLLQRGADLSTMDRQRLQRLLAVVEARSPVERRCQTLLDLLAHPTQQQKP